MNRFDFLVVCAAMTPNVHREYRSRPSATVCMAGDDLAAQVTWTEEMMSTMRKFPGFLLATLIASHAWANDQRASNAWPDTLDGAVSVVVGKLNPNQKSIIRSAAKDNLLVSLAEWAEDIQAVLGLQSGNSKLIAAVCQRACTPNQATTLIMEAAWEALQH